MANNGGVSYTAIEMRDAQHARIQTGVIEMEKLLIAAIMGLCFYAYIAYTTLDASLAPLMRVLGR
mgnify:CR=1 FL=1